MTHRVFGAVHKASNHRRGQLGATDTAKVTECRNIDRPQLCERRVNARRQRLEHVGNICCSQRATFQRDRGELFGRQRLATSVGKQAVDDACHVADVKCG